MITIFFMRNATMMSQSSLLGYVSEFYRTAITRNPHQNVLFFSLYWDCDYDHSPYKNTNFQPILGLWQWSQSLQNVL